MPSLVERLEQAAKKYDRRAVSSAVDGHYDFGAADLRDLLEESQTYIKDLQYALQERTKAWLDSRQYR